MANFQTILVKSTDDEVITTTSRALSEAEGYRVIFCEDDRAAIRRLEEVQVNLFLYDCGDEVPQGDSALVHSRLAHASCARLLLFDRERLASGQELANRTASFLFLFKPVEAIQLSIAAKRALEQAELSRRHRILSRELKLSLDDDLFRGAQESSVQGGYSQFERLVYVSARMAELVAEAKIAAKTDMPVLIQGDTGTGKELLARAIHFNSSRRRSPMLVQNCGGVAENVLHSELFGHVRGGFPGAIADRLGLFRAADGGTILLDEVSDVSPQFQIALLRFLQEGEVKPIGSDTVLHSDVRIIAASNKSLDRLVEQGRFRRDLYYRLRGFQLNVPALADRREDIPVLARFFVEKYAGVVGRRVLGVTADVLRRLEAYPFPGNVRELETEVQRMVAVAEQGGYIAVRHLSEKIAKTPLSEREPLPIPGSGHLKDIVEQVERAVVERALERHHWNQTKVAADLGLSRVGLANKIKRYSLQRDNRA